MGEAAEGSVRRAQFWRNSAQVFSDPSSSYYRYKPKKDQFDTSKLPDLYDNAMHDVIHNAHLNLRALPELYHAARTIAAYVVPQEYGISAADKVLSLIHI